MKSVAFFIRQFSERGTEVSVYNYAHYNEVILRNKSYIICFSDEKQSSFGPSRLEDSYRKFKDRFIVVEINDIRDMASLIDTYAIDFFYTQTHGGEDIYEFHDTSIWKTCKTIKHCVFDTNTPEADLYISISHHLNKKFATDIPVLPLIVDIPASKESLRDELNIPKDAIVIGRHGGLETFDIQDVHWAIKRAVNEGIYFIFLNTNVFYTHPGIIYLPCSTDEFYKAKFINTCDAMIHARSDGETFGLAIAEFSSMNKPVITCNSGDLEHIMILGDKAIIYTSEESLVDIFKNIRAIISSKTDWNAYARFSPENVMKQFKILLE
jgi:glycosyltransferase involved in cell wall biosynthesis